MPKVSRSNLTVGRIFEFKHEGDGQSFLWDSTVSGLAVRATSGSKGFIFERRLNGKTVRITIGNVSAWSLPKAREEARRLQRLMDQGIDPRIEKAEQKAAEEREGMIVKTAWEAFLKSNKGSWAPRHYAEFLYHAKEPTTEGGRVGVLVPLLKMPMMDVDAKAVIKCMETARNADVLSPQNQGKHTAIRQALVRFRAFWRWAHGRKDEYGALADPSLFVNSDLKKLIPPNRAKDDVLQKSQLESWFREVLKIANPVISAYLQILLLTGARRSELAELKWGHVDLKWKSFWIKDKIEQEDGRTLPLTKYVEHLISKLPRRNQWVFSSSTSETGRLAEPRIGHKKALTAAGLPRELTLHGLRRSHITLNEWVGTPDGICSDIVGHRIQNVHERNYMRRPVDLLAVWLQKFEDFVLSEAKVPFDKEAAADGLHLVKDGNKGV